MIYKVNEFQCKIQKIINNNIVLLDLKLLNKNYE
jgi:hypothetical protein